MKKQPKLTKRQKKLLNLIVQLYLNGTQEISSLYIKSLGICNVSSATIRNELNLLTQRGYLTKSHFASGRKPTIKSFILFLKTIYTSTNTKLATQTQFLKNSHLLQEKITFLENYIKRLSMLYSMFTFTTYDNKIKYYGIKTLLTIATNLYSQKIKENYYKFYSFITLLDQPITFRRFLLKSQNNLLNNNFSMQFLHLSSNRSPHIVLGFINYKYKHQEFIGFITPLNLNILKILQDMIYIKQVLNSYENKNTI